MFEPDLSLTRRAVAAFRIWSITALYTHRPFETLYLDNERNYGKECYTPVPSGVLYTTWCLIIGRLREYLPIWKSTKRQK